MRKIFLSALAAAGLLNGAAGLAQTYSNAVMALSPAGYWPLSETVAPVTSGLYVATNSGTLGAAGNGYYETWWQTNATSFTLTNQNSIVHVTGAIAADSDMAMQQGQVGQYVVVPRVNNGVANGGVTITAPFTIEMWVYPTNPAAGQLKPILAEGFNNVQVPSQGYATMAQGVAIGQYSSFIYFNTFNGAGTKSEIDTPTLAMNKWYHIVATFDGTTKRLYTNGVQVGTQAPPVANGANFVPDPVSPLVVGGGNNLGISGGANVPFGGAIDEVAIYRTALSATQVTNHFAAGTNTAPVTPYSQIVSGDSPFIYLRLDEPAFTGPSALTMPVANNFGTLGASANGYYLSGVTPGLPGPSGAAFGAANYAVALNGFNSAIDIGGGNLPSALNPTNGQPLTVTAWFKGNPADCVGRLQTLAGHSDAGWRLNLDNNAGVQFNPGNGPQLAFTGVTDELANGMFVNDGAWHFASAVSDGTNDFLYIDGRLAKRGTSVGVVTNGSPMDVILGGDPQYLAPQPLPVGGGGRTFDGWLAQVAFFTNALTAAQVQGLYSAAGVAPMVTTQPSSQGVNAGTTASIAAMVSGSIPISYQWYAANGSLLSGQTSSNLTFNPVQTGSAGGYYFVATNLYGAVTSAVAQVTVFQPGTYAYAVRQFNPVAYWPLNETVQPPAGQYIATNVGTLGALANGYYQSYYQPLTIGVTNTFYATNNIQHTAGATGDGDTAMVCGNAAGAGQYVVFPRTTNGLANAAVTITAPFSLEAWIKTTNLTASVRPIITEGRNQTQGDASHNYTNSTYGFSLGQYHGFLYFQVYNGQHLDNNGVPELDSPVLVSNAWYHVVVTYDGSTETMYTNGVQVATASASYVPDPTAPLLIGTGTELPAANGGVEFSGAIDDVAIYNAALSQTQVAAHAAAVGANYSATVLADSPSIYLRLDEPAFNNYPALSAYPVATNYGTLGAVANGLYQPGTTPGAAGPSFQGLNTPSVAFNGFYGAVDIGNGFIPQQLNPTGTQPETVAAWFRANPADARFQEIVSRGDSSWRLTLDGYNGSPSTAPYDVHFNPGNNASDLGFTSVNDELSLGCFVNDGNWHFVAGISDGTNASLYIDGAVAKTAPATSLTGSALDAFIGGSPAHTTPVYSGPNIRYFDGQVAQVAYFTNALSVSQLRQIYGVAGVPLTIAQEPPLTQTNNSGSTATVIFAVHGSLPMFQWYTTNVNTGVITPLAGQTNANLVFSPASLGNTGYYFAVATNSLNSVTSSVTLLTIVGPPIILSQTPADVRVFQGTTPTLQVTVQGPSPITYQWLQNGTSIAGATGLSYSPSTAAASTNSYTFTATNSFGGTNATFQVAVLADPTAPYPAQVLADGPVAYYRLDETDGSTAYDYVGANNATYTNVLLGVPGYTSLNSIQSDPNETAAEFGAINPPNNYAGNVPDYLNFGTPNGSNAEFSVEAWVTQYLYANSGDCIVGLGFGGGEQFLLDTGNNTEGDLRFLVRNAAGTVSSAGSSIKLANDGLWHHVVGVCDEAGGHVYVYLDGNQVGSGTITPGSGLLSSTTPLAIGARQSGNDGNYDYQFYGSIDDVAVYNKVLSPAQIQTHYYDIGLPPTITSLTPAGGSAYIGSPLTLTAAVSGTSPLVYQWYQDGLLVSTTTNNGAYTFNALAGSHSYYVSVTNQYNADNPAVSSTVTFTGIVPVTLNPANYTDHLKITFPGYTRNETLGDFPVLVRLSPALTNFSYSHFALANGADLRFTDSTGTRVIPSEIDEWNPTGESTVWVQVPQLTATNTTIWAYWGNSSPDTAIPGTNVWVPQSWEGLPAFDVVYHLKESGFPYADASGQFPAVQGNAPTPVPGIVGTAEAFTNSFLDAGVMNVGNQFSVSAWVNVATNASNIQAIWANKAGGNSSGFAFYVNTYPSTDERLLVETGNGNNQTPTFYTAAGAVTSNQWHLVTAVIDRGMATGRLFVDGQPQGTSGSFRPDFGTNQDVNLGQLINNGFPFNGLIDEARIQSGTNSANWVWASYLTVLPNSGMQSYSAVSSTSTNNPTPVAIHVTYTGGNLVLSGTGGLTSGTYYVVGTTNLTLPIQQWPVLYTNTFDGSGNFNVSIPVDPTKPEEFLSIRQ